ncbi:MAG: FKBP-type peptidyl-prolyl cis-trans isomerase [Acidobacteriota bacterium]|nr:FKBP-type peptidyl-prolyl cis-trans isomerase [Acidobacteriota bacterium]NLH70790.1 FKBP-type peptidyl-prolyl cis-trans isomerase [Brooklawnia sp.]
MSEKPFIEVPQGPAPTELQIVDEVVGEGLEATSGANVLVDYVGVGFDSGKEFDASYNRGEPLSFRLGFGQVIKGWDDGVQGMRVGGRRKLLIPADQAYGRYGIPGVIGPNEALIFVCELRAVR